MPCPIGQQTWALWDNNCRVEIPLRHLASGSAKFKSRKHKLQCPNWPSLEWTWGERVRNGLLERCSKVHFTFAAHRSFKEMVCKYKTWCPSSNRCSSSAQFHRSQCKLTAVTSLHNQVTTYCLQDTDTRLETIKTILLAPSTKLSYFKGICWCRFSFSHSAHVTWFFVYVGLTVPPWRSLHHHVLSFHKCSCHDNRMQLICAVFIFPVFVAITTHSGFLQKQQL